MVLTSDDMPSVPTDDDLEYEEIYYNIGTADIGSSL